MASSSSVVLTCLSYYEGLWENATDVDRPVGSNLDIIRNDSDEGRPATTTTFEIAICHLSSILGFVGFGNTQFNRELYEVVSAVALAVHHLNTGDGSLVERVKYIPYGSPNLKFTLQVADLGVTPGEALAKVIDLTSDDSLLKQRKPCAIVGAMRSLLTVPTSMITGIRGYPQISGASTSKALDDKTMYPLFARTVLSDNENSPPILQFLRDNWHVQHLAVLHFNEPYGNAYADGLREAVKQQFPDVALVTVTVQYDNSETFDPKTIEEAIESLND